VDPIVMAFGTALVGAMATDTWAEARSAVIALWRRFRPRAQADAVEDDLDRLRELAMAARTPERANTEKALVAVWQGKLQELALDKPDAVEELRTILSATLVPMLDAAKRERVHQIIMVGTSHDNSTLTQVAGDQFSIRL
jgi:hypothetical protein